MATSGGTDGTEVDRNAASDFVFARRRSIMLFVVAMVVVTLLGWAGDKRSCERQVPIRIQSNVRASVLKDFLLSAATARQQSAQLELKIDHKHQIHSQQASIDLLAATVYLAQAARVKVLPVPNCAGVFPPVN